MTAAQSEPLPDSELALLRSSVGDASEEREHLPCTITLSKMRALLARLTRAESERDAAMEALRELTTSSDELDAALESDEAYNSPEWDKSMDALEKRYDDAWSTARAILAKARP